MNRRLEAGAQVGAYTVERPLDEGGFGTVYRCRHEDGRPAALKLFKDSVETATAQRLVAQQNEIEALVRLRHPSLIELYEYGITEATGLYLAMELAEGEPLDRYLGRVGRMDTVEALLIARKIAEALAHCHAFGVLHLDLKPSNIVVVDPHEPRIKILDFGLATLTATWHAEHARVAAGTIAYMAPECLVRGADARPSPRMDLYALGTVLYEALTGSLPFNTESMNVLIQEKLAGAFKPVSETLPGTPGAVDALVSALLCRNPAQRISNAAHVVARLREAYFETLRGTKDAEAKEATPGAPQGRSLQQAEVRFIGRTRELDELSNRVLSASQAEGGHVLLQGEAGVGKSRLFAELFRGIELSGLAFVAYGRCRELSAVVPYSALRESLSQIPAWLQKQSEDRVARVRAAITRVMRQDGGVISGLVPELSDLAAATPSSNDIGPGGTRGVADAIAALIASVSEEVPVVLAIEDLQWADEATLGVLERLSKSLLGLPAMLALSARPGVPEAALKRIAALDVVPLEPLSAAENRALIATVTGGASDEVVARLLKLVPLLGAGNPLFSIQILHHLETEGWLRRTEGGEIELAAGGDGGFAAPASLTEVLARSLARLSARASEVLAVGALIGRQFSTEDLANLGLFDAGEAASAAAEAEAALLCRVEDGVVWLSHEGVRDHLVAKVPVDRLADYHGRIARRMEERAGEPGPLAHHLELAGEKSRAADAYFAAGVQASRMQDLIGASRAFRRAIELLLELPQDDARSDRLARAAHELARCACLLGNTSDTLETLKKIAAALPESPLTTAALSSSLARVHYVRGEFVDAVGHSRKALGAAATDPSLQRYQCLPANIIGRALAAGGKFGPALDPLKKGCALADAADEHVELCHSRGILSVAESYTGHFADAEESAAAAAKLAERLRDPARLMGSWFYYAVLAEARGDWESGLKSTAKLLAYAEEHGLSGLYLYTGTMFAGRHQFHIGQLHRARVLLSNAINLGKVLGIGMGQGWAQAWLGDVYLVQGRLDDARYCYEKAIEVAQAGAGDAYALGLGKIGKMHYVALHDRDLAATRAVAAEAIDGLRASGNRSTLVTAFERYADALADLGQAEESAAAISERDALATELGLLTTNFWPNVPVETPVVTARQYWMTSRVDPAASSAPQRPASAGQSDSQSGEQRIRMTLFETLAAVEGFVPTFDPKSDQVTAQTRKRTA